MRKDTATQNRTENRFSQNFNESKFKNSAKKKISWQPRGIWLRNKSDIRSVPSGPTQIAGKSVAIIEVEGKKGSRMIKKKLIRYN